MEEKPILNQTITHTHKIPIEEKYGDIHSSNSLYIPKAQTLPLFSLTTLYLCPTSTITPNPKPHHLHFSSTSNLSLPQCHLYPLPAMEITRNPLPLSALVVGFTCKTQTLGTLAISSSPRRRIPIITHIPISFTLLRNRNFQVPSKGSRNSAQKWR